MRRLLEIQDAERLGGARDDVSRRRGLPGERTAPEERRDAAERGDIRAGRQELEKRAPGHRRISWLHYDVVPVPGAQIPDHISLITTVATTTVIWVSVTFLGPQTTRDTLVSFYRLVRPAGPGWNAVRAEAGVTASPDSPAQALIGWVCGCLFVYSALFGTGSLLYGRMPQFYAWLAMFVASGVGMWRVLHTSGANAEGG